MYDSIQNVYWNQLSENAGSKTNDIDIVNVDHRRCADYTSDTIQSSIDYGYDLGPQQKILGKNYTFFHIFQITTDNTNWRTFYRNNSDHLMILGPDDSYGAGVGIGTQDYLGMYSNRNGSWRAAKDDNDNYITIPQNKWMVIIAVGIGQADQPDDTTLGELKFYTNDDANNNEVKYLGKSDRVCCGTSLLYFGGDWAQHPGYIMEAGIINQALDSDELDTLMALLVTKMNTYIDNTPETNVIVHSSEVPSGYVTDWCRVDGPMIDSVPKHLFSQDDSSSHIKNQTNIIDSLLNNSTTYNKIRLIRTSNSGYRADDSAWSYASNTMTVKEIQVWEYNGNNFIENITQNAGVTTESSDETAFDGIYPSSKAINNNIGGHSHTERWTTRHIADGEGMGEYIIVDVGERLLSNLASIVIYPYSEEYVEGGYTYNDFKII